MENQTTQNPVQEPFQPVQPVQPIQPSKTNNFLVILLSFLLLLTTSLAFFFALQNQKLAKQMASVQVQSTPSPIPTATPDETASQAPTGDLANQSITIKYSSKSDWQTYIDEVAKFSLQYDTIPTPPYSSHQSLGNHQAGKSITIMGCNTPPSGPGAGQEVCLEQYTVTVYANYNGGSRRDWMGKNINDYPNCQRYYADVSVAGKNSLLATSDCSSWGETYVLIPNGSQMIVFLTKGYSRNNTTGKITLPGWIQEALSTFQFTN